MHAYAKRLQRKIDRARSKTGGVEIVASIRGDSSKVLSLAGMEPDPWQAQLIGSESSKTLALCGRQVGKSRSAAGAALRRALLYPGSTVLLVAPVLRQAAELYAKVRELFNDLGRPVGVRRETVLTMTLRNGSRIICLPGASEKNIRGYAANLVVLDEAARIPDETFKALRPTLATTKGRVIALSSAFAKVGWFFEAWDKGGKDWEKISVPSSACPRIPKEFLAEERAIIGARWYAMEYELEFQDSIAACFDGAAIDRAAADDIPAMEW